jgi:hypothetical protein
MRNYILIQETISFTRKFIFNSKRFYITIIWQWKLRTVLYLHNCNELEQNKLEWIENINAIV